MTAVAPLPSRNIYVPAPARPIDKPAAEAKQPYRRTPLTKAEAKEPASARFRRVAWDDSPAEEPAPALQSRRIRDLPVEVRRARAKSFFSQFRWTGEQPTAPTEVQLKTSVRSVFDSFPWE